MLPYDKRLSITGELRAMMALGEIDCARVAACVSVKDPQHVGTDGQTDERTDGTGERLDGRTDGRTGRADGRTDGRTGGRNGRTERADGRTDVTGGRTNGQTISQRATAGSYPPLPFLGTAIFPLWTHHRIINCPNPFRRAISKYYAAPHVCSYTVDQEALQIHALTDGDKI